MSRFDIPNVKGPNNIDSSKIVLSRQTSASNLDKSNHCQESLIIAALYEIHTLSDYSFMIVNLHVHPDSICQDPHCFADCSRWYAN